MIYVYIYALRHKTHIYTVEKKHLGMLMKFLVVNSMSMEIEEALKKQYKHSASPGTKIDFVSPDGGPVKVGRQVRYFMSRAEYFILKTIMKNQEGYDAIIINCGLDPAIDSGREVSKIPIVGPGEASMLIAGGKFTVLCACEEAVPIYNENIQRYGLTDKMMSVRPIGIHCDDLSKDPELTKGAMIRQAKEAIEKDGAQVIVPGFVTVLAAEVEKAVNVSVVNPVVASVKWAEMICAMGTQP